MFFTVWSERKQFLAFFWRFLFGCLVVFFGGLDLVLVGFAHIWSFCYLLACRFFFFFFRKWKQKLLFFTDAEEV